MTIQSKSSLLQTKLRKIELHPLMHFQFSLLFIINWTILSNWWRIKLAWKSFNILHKHRIIFVYETTCLNCPEIRVVFNDYEAHDLLRNIRLVFLYSAYIKPLFHFFDTILFASLQDQNKIFRHNSRKCCDSLLLPFCLPYFWVSKKSTLWKVKIYFITYCSDIGV